MYGMDCFAQERDYIIDMIPRFVTLPLYYDGGLFRRGTKSTWKGCWGVRGSGDIEYVNGMDCFA